ncbi:Monocarboxylate transporter 8 [Orchesella cincta]|uniref:Monocarboxylate transporter 8 n=1 Tax=Orchesella cincta TaxID=48709 RepID=A0A1D2NF89_ORCCI|nr:Monocarboxylate transporter 8 [Orchesella cincta]
MTCIGPSTLTSFGLLTIDLPISPTNQSWLLVLLYGFWQASAILASLYAKESPRQLATLGSALAAIGFLISASFVEDPSWLYLTFSIFIGFGLGLSFHTAYLVVMSNFERYKGLANGICQLSIAIGQITTPLLYSVVSMPKDRFQIKALTTAVGFLTTLFFVVPNHTVPRRPSTVVNRNRRYSTASRRSSYGEAVPLQVGINPVSSNSYPINQGQMRPRRRSQYLLAVSTSLLPNIPEEPESSNSINETLASTSSESDIPTLQQTLASQSVAVLPCGNNDNSSTVNNSIQKTEGDNDVTTTEGEEDGVTKESENEFQVFTLHAAVRRKSEGCLPSYVGNFSEVNNKVGNGTATPVPNDKKTENKSVAQLNRQNSESQSKLRQSNSSIVVGKQLNINNIMRQSSSTKTAKQGESTIDLSLLSDFHFCNMAAFSALCTVSVVNFPLVLYAYVISFCEECKEEANTAVLIIYVADLISRLVISYLSDYQLLRRRTAFLIACSFAGLLVAATTLVKDISLIYCFSVLYGLCLATLVSSEYLMFIESFGFDRFPQAYGIINIFKIIVAAALGAFIGNPLSIYLYPIHPLDLKADDRNASLFCDPLDLFDSNQPTSSSMTRLLLNVAVPSILCAVAWIMEDIYKASHKCSEQTTKTQISSNANNSEVP